MTPLAGTPAAWETPVRERLAAAGHRLDQQPLACIGSGFHTVVYSGRTREGVPIVLKRRRDREADGFGVASWAGLRLAVAGLPVPRVLWHDHELCIETAIAGLPAGSTGLAAVVEAGRVLRRIHEIKTRGFGRLGHNGAGTHTRLADWLVSRDPAADLRDVPGAETTRASGVAQRARAALHDLADQLPTREPRLLHGDYVARHVLTCGDVVRGVIDLDSVRGGDPAADLAGWSLQEPRARTTALFAGYRPGTDRSVRRRLTAHRVRIASALAGFQHRYGAPDRAQLHLRQLRDDLDGLETGRTRLFPTLTPPEPPTHGGPR